jgi:predicted transcriptional regulator
VKKILQAAANAEIAAMLHWRSPQLVSLMRTVISSTLPNDRREAIRLHEAEIEAILKDLERGRFYTVAGIEFWIAGKATAGFAANSPRE